jgi:leucyl-tRNA synthetase
MSKENVYDFKGIENKWLEVWNSKKIYKAREDGSKSVYILGMFPYPSGDGLHTGHVRIYTATDVLARYMRMKGFDVLYPMGWDAFGLPAENAAIKKKVNPKKLVPINEANFKRQMQMVGLSYDFDREISTTDPKYYRWTQWLFLKLYGYKNEKGERILYRKEVPINWCPSCKTGLANEEVLPNGTHERCGTPIEQRNLPQWMFRITDFADELLDDLQTVSWQDEEANFRKGLDWPKGILEMQKNWIGRKSGHLVKFLLRDIKDQNDDVHSVQVFTTRLDTIAGISFIAISPELALDWINIGWNASDEVKRYVDQSITKLEQQRLEDAADKTGVDTGIKAVNPVTKEVVPVYVADYVLSGVGSGALMGVPAHDKRDEEFAKKYNLPIVEVIKTIQQDKFEDGVVLSPQRYAGITSAEAREKIASDLGSENCEKKVTYHLRDWVYSRQRYWGEPIPLIYCEKCGDENGVVPLEESDLPLELPDMESYEPSGTGESPLVSDQHWVRVQCPKCGGEAKRETDTMPNWAGSCWYFLRFADPHNDQAAWDNEKLRKWLPVDWYLGGAEHAVLHLLYARFWVKIFKRLGLLDFDEPFLRLRGVGMVLAEDGKKMSKSLGNIVNPDDVVERFGADALRIYEMFMGPWDQAIAWETRSLVGCYRFLEKVFKHANSAVEAKTLNSTTELSDSLNELIAKVERDIPAIKFNTSVAAFMEFVNLWGKDNNQLSVTDLEKFLKVLAPFAPFVAEEIWSRLGHSESIHLSAWPVAENVRRSNVEVIVSVNGKYRGVVTVSPESAQDQSAVESAVRDSAELSRWISEVKKIIFVPGRLINFLV